MLQLKAKFYKRFHRISHYVKRCLMAIGKHCASHPSISCNPSCYGNKYAGAGLVLNVTYDTWEVISLGFLYFCSFHLFSCSFSGADFLVFFSVFFSFSCPCLCFLFHNIIYNWSNRANATRMVGKTWMVKPTGKDFIYIQMGDKSIRIYHLLCKVQWRII